MIVHVRGPADLASTPPASTSKSTLHLVVHCPLEEVAQEILSLLSADGVYSITFIQLSGDARRLAAFVKDTPIFCAESADEAEDLIRGLIAAPVSQAQKALNAEQVVPRFLSGFPT